VSKSIGYDLLGGMLGSPGEVDRDPIALWILVFYIIAGALIYMFYGYRNSKITHPTQTPAE
jgi:hypothetical protein